MSSEFMTKDGETAQDTILVGEGLLARDILFVKYPHKLAMALENGEMAAIVAHLDYWVGKNSGDVGFVHNNHTWAMARISDIRKSIPWLSERTIRRYLKTLLAGGWIEKAHLRHGITNKTAFYRPNYAKLEELGIASQGRLISRFPKVAAKLDAKVAAKLDATGEIGIPVNGSLGLPASSETPPGGKDSFESTKPHKQRSAKQLAYDVPLNAFAEAYKKVYGADYVFSAGRDHAVIRDLIRQSPSKNGEFAVEFQRRLDLAIKQHAPGNKWEQFPPDLSALRMRWNRLVESALPKLSASDEAEKRAAYAEGLEAWRKNGGRS